MKKGYVIILCVAVTLVIATALSSSYISTTLKESDASSTRGMPVTFYIDADYPSLDSKSLNLYKIVPDEFNPSRFQSIGNLFGLTGEIEFIDNDIVSDTFVITNDDNSLEYHLPTGVWRYVSDEAYPVVSRQPSLPSNTEAQKVAESFLKDNGFWSDNMVFSHITYSYQRMGDKSTEEIIEEFVLAKKVCFKRNINDIEIGGVGSKCTVTIGENGDIVAFMQPTRAFAPVKGDVIVIEPDEALENFKLGRGIRSLVRTNFSDREVTISDISLSYYVNSLLEDPGIINLCYKYEGTFSDGMDFLAYTDAVEIL